MNACAICLCIRGIPPPSPSSSACKVASEGSLFGEVGCRKCSGGVFPSDPVKHANDAMPNQLFHTRVINRHRCVPCLEIVWGHSCQCKAASGGMQRAIGLNVIRYGPLKPESGREKEGYSFPAPLEQQMLKIYSSSIQVTLYKTLIKINNGNGLCH